jgi:two-component system, OmpR family, heavy metal sensor histidine kinase CusS
MLSKRTEPRSIATQLVLLFTLCAAFLLSSGLGVLYWIVVRHASEEDNVVLADRVDAFQADFEERGGANAPGLQIDARRGSPFYVRILDPAGFTIRETPGMEELATNIFPLAASREIAMPIEHRSHGKFYVLTTRHALRPGEDLRETLPANRFFTIQVAQDRSEDERFRKQFGTLAVVVVLLGSVVAAALAVTVTRRGLRPLTQMSRALERVQPAHLNERIDPGRWPSELRPVAASFDDMLTRLEDSFTRLSQFSADLAHELRTPIGNMLGEAQVALTRQRSPNEYRAVIESAATECERLSGIIDNLLFLARAESAEQQISRSTFDAHAAVEKNVSFYQTLAEDRHVEIACTGEAEIFADPMLFNRALGNLIENALRFTPDNGRIRIAISDGEKRVEISVADNGSGIAPEHLPRVFDRFYRADPSRSSAGTGLGLSLVKSIAHLHGGSVSIESQSNRGTTVTLTFPSKA